MKELLDLIPTLLQAFLVPLSLWIAKHVVAFYRARETSAWWQLLAAAVRQAVLSVEQEYDKSRSGDSRREEAIGRAMAAMGARNVAEGAKLLGVGTPAVRSIVRNQVEAEVRAQKLVKLPFVPSPDLK